MGPVDNLAYTETAVLKRSPTSFLNFSLTFTVALLIIIIIFSLKYFYSYFLQLWLNVLLKVTQEKKVGEGQRHNSNTQSYFEIPDLDDL